MREDMSLKQVDKPNSRDEEYLQMRFKGNNFNCFGVAFTTLLMNFLQSIFM